MLILAFSLFKYQILADDNLIDFDTGQTITKTNPKINLYLQLFASSDERPYYINNECYRACSETTNHYYFTDTETKKCYNKKEGWYFKGYNLYTYCPSEAPYHSYYTTQCQEQYVGYHYQYSYASDCSSTFPSTSLATDNSNRCLKCTTSPNLYYDSAKGTSNSCVSSCPTERPYVDEYNECIAEWLGVAKYYTNGTKKCKTNMAVEKKSLIMFVTQLAQVELLSMETNANGTSNITLILLVEIKKPQLA